MQPKIVKMIPKYFFFSLSFSRIKLANIKIPRNKIIFDAVRYFTTYLPFNFFNLNFMSIFCKKLEVKFSTS